jgi:hypothetical protein
MVIAIAGARLMSLSPEDVPEESKFLLGVDYARLWKGVKAAVTAG